MFYFINLQYFKLFSAILIKWQKNENFRTEKISADTNFGRMFFRPKVFVLNVSISSIDITMNICDETLLYDIAQHSKASPTYSGILGKRCSSLKKWVEKYCILYQNLLFEYEDTDSSEPTSILHLEHCSAERLQIKNIEDIEQVCVHLFSLDFIMWSSYHVTFIMWLLSSDY